MSAWVPEPHSALESAEVSYEFPSLDILPPFTGPHILLLGEKLKPKPNFSINLDFFFEASYVAQAGLKQAM